MVEHTTDSGHVIGKEFPDQMELTQKTGVLIRQINASDIPATEKAFAIKNLKGITRAQMEAITKTTGSTLSESIIKFIESQKV